ncbi:DUF4268 domain-containing protein [Burkholderia thailandensis]|uniref:DUF4268 domain-containing protein n=1 Tax=Burkholderia thailandensis TaxID=57975 RepID=UPI00107E8455|nr:DUF4268 domain-containing protein [Burkholderia thailandensis]TGB33048.1 DUF4268 domain-containing protein [Burkholderia thailandensis]
MKAALARLERVNLREAWRHEASEFTPWLAQDDNLQLLAQALGLTEIELVAIEHPVGDFKVDILCTDDDGEIIIENQLEPTDHRHLGQIVTYAAGVGAKKVIWVAESFRPEHLAALEFLNQNTTGALNFFAAEIELWRIAESPLAPSFNVVVKPNDWSKSGREVARAATTATPVKQMQLLFWQGYVAYLQDKQSTLRPHTPRPQHWLNAAIGRAGFELSATVNVRESKLAIAIYIRHEQSKAYFQQLHQRKMEIERQLGFVLDWQELPDSHACRIGVARTESPLSDEARWTEYFAWFSEHGEKLDQVFRPIIRGLA